MKPFVVGVIFAVCAAGLFTASQQAMAADKPLSIVTVTIQDVMAKSQMGQQAQQTLQEKASVFQKELQQAQDELVELQKQIEMKSSVWSAEIRDEREREYQRKMRAMQMRNDDAKYELRQLEKKTMEPIFKELNDVITSLGQKNRYSLILDSRSGVLYADDALDITDLVVKELNARKKK